MTNTTIELDGTPTYTFPTPQDSVIGKILIAMGRGKALNTTKPIKVECGPKPADAETNCKPAKAPCLYNVATDPCEYHNIAEKFPGEWHGEGSIIVVVCHKSQCSICWKELSKKF